ncbi:MAG TPA: hypothetical protein VNI57_01650, partial [Candidatus Saccharimonadales bacterium]|nr:hypothetical protein [Candidatus Saccharimonadales bacterium]
VLTLSGKCQGKPACGAAGQMPCAPPVGCDTGLVPGADGKCGAPPEPGQVIEKGQNLVGQGSAAAGGALAALRCPAPPDVNGCPFEGPAGQVQIFNRCMGPQGRLTGSPTPAGNAACDGIQEVHRLLDRLGTSALATRDAVKARLDQATARVTDKMMSQGLLDAVSQVAETEDDIKADFATFMSDPVCGSQAALQHLSDYFQSTKDAAQAFTQAAIKDAQAAKEWRLAQADVLEADRASKSLSRKYGDHPQVTAQIAGIVSRFSSAMAEPAGSSAPAADSKPAGHSGDPNASSPGGGGNQGGNQGGGKGGGPPSHAGGGGDETCGGAGEPPCEDLATQCDEGLSLDQDTLTCEPPKLGLFVASCVDCGLGLASTVGGIGVTVATWETGVGAVVGVVFTAVGVVGTGLGCTATAVDWHKNKEGYKARMALNREKRQERRKHRRDSRQAASSQRSAPSDIDAAGKDLGTGAGGDVRDVSEPLRRALAHLQSWEKIAFDELEPLEDKAATLSWEDFSGNADQLVACYENLQTLRRSIGADAKEGATQIAEGMTDERAIEKAVAHVRELRDKATAAAQDEAQARWEKARASASDLYTKMTGLREGARSDGGAIGSHLADLVQQPGSLESLKASLDTALGEADRLVDEVVSETEANLDRQTGDLVANTARKSEQVRAKLESGLARIKEARARQASE